MTVALQVIFSVAAGLLGFFSGSKFSCETFACFFKSNRWGRLIYFGMIGFIIARLLVDLHPFGWF